MPEFDPCGPYGIVKEGDDTWRTATDAEALELEFPGYFEFTVQGDESLEENIAEQLDIVIERLQKMATDLRVKASARK